MSQSIAETERDPNPIRVALVDDHALYRGGLRDLLAAHGCAIVAEAKTGEDALALVADTAPDVVVMDVHLPGIGGIEATRRINAGSPACRVLMLTVSPDDSDVNEAILAGACGYMLKDASTKEIVSAVGAAARGEALLSPAIAGRLLERIRSDESFVELPANARPQLTDREVEVLRQVAEGRDNGQIADELVISVQTVKNHVSNVLAKLQVGNRTQAAVIAVKHRLV